jgi:membrane-bound lytic murein transglycosylase MltF
MEGRTKVMKRLMGAVLGTVLALAATPVLAQTRAPAGGLSAQQINQPWTGDFDAMRQRRVVRVIVPYSKTLFFVDRGRQLGVAAEFGQQLEDWLNRRFARGPIRMNVAFVPTRRDQLFSALKDGRGDVVIANLTITEARNREVDFTKPWLTNVNEIVVTGARSPALADIASLAGQEIMVRRSSSYFTHLSALSARFVAEGRPAINLRAASEDIEDEDLLEMVNAGLLPLAVVDDHKAKSWAAVFPKLALRPDLVVSGGGEIGWAIRENSPQLKTALDAFLAENREGTSFGNTIRRRYFGGVKAVRPALADEDVSRFNGLWTSFHTHGQAKGFDPVMLAAQGYQESQLVQSRRSHRGAVGVMQLLPATAAARPVSIRDVASDADINIKAGATYMNHLREAYVTGEALDPRNRLLMSLAAYNAGPGNLRKFRRRAVEMGLNPDIWFNNVEQAAAQIVGRETVQYVSNIYKYYLSYNLLLERDQARNRALPPR